MVSAVSQLPLPNQAPVVTLTAPLPGATYTAPAAITIGATAIDVDGAVTIVEFYAGTILIGSDGSSPYSMTWTDVPGGTYALTAVAYDDSGARTTSAPRTMTVIPPNRPPLMSLTAPADGATFTAPATITVSGAASDPDGMVSSVEFYAGTTLIGSDTSSPYEVTWTNVPEGSYSLTAVARDEDGASTTSTARSITVTAPPNQAPTVSLTEPANGATFTAPATISVSATASDTDGSVANVEFYAGTTLIGSDTSSPYSVTWTNVPAGSYQLTAIATDDDESTTTTAARTITVTAPNQAPTVSLTEPADGATFTVPATITVNATASDTDGTVTAVDFYAGTTLIGSDTSSPYSVTWTNVPAGSYQLTAIATDDDESTTTSAARTITVTAPNQASTVSLTEPANGATFTAPATITVTATASDTDGTVANVEFFAGTTLIGTDTTSPYSITWNSVPAGSYALTAVAHDDSGATTTSSARTITVTAPNEAPTVSITTPVNGATFTAPATVAVAATADDADGTITTVDFYAGTTLIGTDTTSPYGATWNNVPAGNYQLTAVAQDEDGSAMTSAAVSITVTSANQVPTVSLTAPANGATFSAPATISITATASDPDGTITTVEFYADGTTLLGSDTTSPYGISWSNVPAGNYQLTAVARDDSGGITVSAARSIAVNAPTMPGRALFTASADHESNVDYYVVEIFPQGADPETANAVAAQNIGKPPVVSGECEADIRAMIQSLSPGGYIATVSAFSGEASSRSAASAPFTR